MGLPFLMLFVPYSSVCVFVYGHPLFFLPTFLKPLTHLCVLRSGSNVLILPEWPLNCLPLFVKPFLHVGFKREYRCNCFCHRYPGKIYVSISTVPHTHTHTEASMVGGYAINPPLGPGSLITHTPVGSVSLSQLLPITTPALSFHPLQFLAHWHFVCVYINADCVCNVCTACIRPTH